MKPVVKTHSSFMIKAGDLFFRYRNGLFPLAFLVLALISRPKIFLNKPSLDQITTTVGVLTAVVGQLFRMAVIGYAYIKRGGKEGKVYADHLVVKGFYNHSRNPMYVGNILIVIGICVVYGSLWAYFLIVPFFIFAYLAITITEENYLYQRFGKEYEQYVQRVNRFWPNFRNIRESLKDFRYDWKRALRKDYGNIFQTLGSLLFIGTWKATLLVGRKAMFTSGLMLVFLLIFYGAVRFLKKGGFLVSPDHH